MPWCQWDLIYVVFHFLLINLTNFNCRRKTYFRHWKVVEEAPQVCNADPAGRDEFSVWSHLLVQTPLHQAWKLHEKHESKKLCLFPNWKFRHPWHEGILWDISDHGNVLLAEWVGIDLVYSQPFWLWEWIFWLWFWDGILMEIMVNIDEIWRKLGASVMVYIHWIIILGKGFD